MADFPSLACQKGPRQQWAEPVTGSSSIPAAGAKKRETKSNPESSDRAVTMIPRADTFLSRPMSGLKRRTASASLRSTR